MDFGLKIGLRYTGIGDVTFAANAAYLLKYFRDVSPDIQILLDARAAGDINIDTVIPEGGDQIRRDQFPKWRGSGSLTWKLGQFPAGGFVNYTGSRTEERRVGHEWFSTCRSRLTPYH